MPQLVARVHVVPDLDIGEPHARADSLCVARDCCTQRRSANCPRVQDRRLRLARHAHLYPANTRDESPGCRAIPRRRPRVGRTRASQSDGERYPARGVVAFAVQYRLADRKSNTPIEQVEDALDAIRCVRAHAGEYGVDKRRVIAHGVSAGGYLSAMAAGSHDDGARPNAMVLWSPGLGDGNDAYFQGLLIGRAKGPDVAPTKHMRDPMPATMIISGVLDSVTFDAEARSYCARLTRGGGRCDIHSYPNLGHLLSRRIDARSQQRGQFDWDEAATADTLERVWAFLRSLGSVAH